MLLEKNKEKKSVLSRWGRRRQARPTSRNKSQSQSDIIAGSRNFLRHHEERSKLLEERLFNAETTTKNSQRHSQARDGVVRPYLCLAPALLDKQNNKKKREKEKKAYKINTELSNT